jgi:hypothetical protein
VPAFDRHHLLEQLRAAAGPPATARDLARQLAIPREMQATFRRELKALVADGALVVVRGNRYTLPDRVHDVSGRLQGHASGIARDSRRRGAGVFIPASRCGGAMHGDRVVARVESGRDAERLEGRLLEVQERRSARIVGQVRRDRRGWRSCVPSTPGSTPTSACPPTRCSKRPTATWSLSRSRAGPVRPRMPPPHRGGARRSTIPASTLRCAVQTASPTTTRPTRWPRPGAIPARDRGRTDFRGEVVGRSAANTPAISRRHFDARRPNGTTGWRAISPTSPLRA